MRFASVPKRYLGLLLELVAAAMGTFLCDESAALAALERGALYILAIPSYKPITYFVKTLNL
ncbi:hypothetical protein KIM372_01280 [Bombiscardovia nodaiensis]|uniref:Uncharacterized protein n=1 Tax=Bombiscardovia nodaiensis TaxID=2932181 RepID=A0ABM8B5T0_9BIFI|nr:hypothetical protein KIM372_01280 [Bombiscardovia nodaiensis]